MKKIYYHLDTKKVWTATYEFDNGEIFKVPLILEPKTEIFNHFHYYVIPQCFLPLNIIKETIEVLE